jgi:hypothetical protein
MAKTSMYPASQRKLSSWNRTLVVKSSSNCALDDERNLRVQLEVGGAYRGYCGDTVLDTMADIIPHLPVLMAGAIAKAKQQARYSCDNEMFACFQRLGWDRATFITERNKLRVELRTKAETAKNPRSA